MVSKSSKRKFEKEFVKNFKIESILNREGNLLPFAYYNPASEGKVTWACGEDQNGRITSVFKFEDSSSDQVQKNCEYVTHEKALEMRNVLIENGWRKSRAPGVTMKHPDTGKPLNRKERRQVARHLIRNKGILDKEKPHG